MPNPIVNVLASAPGVRRIRLETGATLFRPDDACPGFLILEAGAIRVTITSEQGREIVLYRVLPGDICLETFACLVQGKSYAAEGRIETEIQGLLIAPSTFAQFMETEAQFRDLVFGAVARRFHEFEHLVETLAFTGLEARLAEALEKLQDENGVVNATHEALAAEIGSAREAVSRQLGRWAQEGLVELARGRVRVLKRGALERFVTSSPTGA